MNAPDRIALALKAAERAVARRPSDAQKETGNYAKGHLTAHGLPITIENPKGSTRSGMGRDGKRWTVTMPAAYGYVKGTTGKDGDHVDVYLGRDHASRKVFVVDQIDAETGRFDEHKALLSYPSKTAALADYKKAFSDGKADQRIGAVTELSIDDFKDWVGSGATKKPLGDLRKNYATGGKIDMPLLKGKQNIGRNISEMQKSGRPRDQAIAAALRVARGKADGGEVTPTWEERLLAIQQAPNSVPSRTLRNLNQFALEAGDVAADMGDQLSHPLATVHPFGAPTLTGPAWLRMLSALARGTMRPLPDVLKETEPQQRYTKHLDQSKKADGGAVTLNDRPLSVSPPYVAEALALARRYAMGGPAVAGHRPERDPDLPPTDDEIDWITALPRYQDYERQLDVIDRTPDSPWTPWRVMPGEVDPNMPNVDVEPILQGLGAPWSPQAPRRMNYADGGWAGEMDSPAEISGEMTRSPVASWLLELQRQARETQEPLHGARVPAGLFEPFVGPAELGFEMTGIPSVVRGVRDIGAGNNVRGAAQIAAGALPGLSVGRATAPLIAPFFATMPRTMLTSTALMAPGVADDVARSAQASEAAKYEGPTEQQKKSKAWVKGEQQRLKAKNLYGGDVEGVWGPGIEGALKQEWKLEKDEARRQRIEEERIAADREKARAATTQTEEATQARKAAATRKSEADVARSTIRREEEESPYAEYLRTYAPWLAVLPGMYLGNKAAKWSGDKITEGALLAMKNADKLVRGDPRFNEKLGKLNKFWSEGQTGVPAAERQNIFLRDDAAVRAPYWRPNPAAPESSALYPAPSKGKEYVLGAALPAIFGGAETAGGFAGAYYFGNQAEHAQQAMNDPSASAADILANAAQKESAENKAAIAEAFARLGMGTAAYGIPKSAFDTLMRKPMRPNVAKADEWRTDLINLIGKAKGAETAAAKQPKPPKRKAKPKAPKKPSGGNAAPLLPLTAGALLSGETPSESVFPTDLSALPGASPISSPMLDQDMYADGGTIKAQGHHSSYQPRNKVGKWSGGPVWPKKVNGPSKAHGGGVSAQTLALARKYANGGAVSQGSRYRYDDPMGVEPWEPTDVDWLQRRRDHLTATSADAPPSVGNPNALLFGAGLGTSAHMLARSIMPLPIRAALAVAGLYGMYKGGQGLVDDYKQWNSVFDAAAERRELDALLAKKAGSGERRAHGGAVTGPMTGATGGRSDALPISVPSGSFIIPADCVAALGDGNSNAGLQKLEKMFGANARSRMAGGGSTPVDIKISDGEYIVPPEAVARIGKGDMRQGHKTMDAFVKKVRQQHIKTLKKLPAPAA